MFSFLQPSELPVVEGLEKHELIYAEKQPEYNALRVIRSNTEQKAVLSRWTLTQEQRAAIAEGADVYLEMWTFGFPLQPVRMAIGMEVDPSYIKETLALTD